MLRAKLWNRCARLGLLENRDDLAVLMSSFFHAESSAFILRENSTFGLRYFPGGLPDHYYQLVRNTLAQEVRLIAKYCANNHAEDVHVKNRKERAIITWSQYGLDTDGAGDKYKPVSLYIWVSKEVDYFPGSLVNILVLSESLNCFRNPSKSVYIMEN